MGRIVVASMLIAACEPVEREEVGSLRQPIVGGMEDTTHQAVIALISVDSLTHPMHGETCTGTVIAVDGGAGIVLTAAHCFEHFDAGWPMVAVMGDDYSDFLDAGRPVRDVLLHPFYSHLSGGGFADDFALLRFDVPSGLMPVPALPPELDDLQIGTPLTLVGFGFTNHTDVNTRRMEITRPLWQLDDTQLAFDQSHGAGGQCQGDSGGPALYAGHVAGVISYGDTACAMSGVSGRVSNVYDGFVATYLRNEPPSMEQSCGDCQAQQLVSGGACFTQYQRCTSDPACVSVATCENACGADGGCVSACAQQSAQGATEYDAIDACACAACAQCARECGRGSDAGMPVADAGVPDAGLPVGPSPPNMPRGGGCSVAGELLPLATLALIRRRRADDCDRCRAARCAARR
jgi:hypothetical protein